jgi:hypothetical protein
MKTIFEKRNHFLSYMFRREERGQTCKTTRWKQYLKNSNHFMSDMFRHGERGHTTRWKPSQKREPLLEQYV